MNPDASDIYRCSDDERRTTLRLGFRRLQASWPKCQTHGIVVIGVNRVPVTIVFELPGVLVVQHRFTGAIIARSMRGRPLELDPLGAAQL